MYLNEIKNVTTKIAAAATDSVMVCPIVIAEAKIIPITAARIPFIAAFTTEECFNTSTKRDNKTVKAAGGVNMATVASKAPNTPATL